MNQLSNKQIAAYCINQIIVHHAPSPAQHELSDRDHLLICNQIQEMLSPLERRTQKLIEGREAELEALELFQVDQ